ncbi:amidohydrolase [[Micrococcus luteus] ATCC 49442]|uniref:amidohydrolase n=1 Tax=[Micrococcus luteus] ATCC 49442 TaxID=2698727 RepID=UPI001FCB2C3B|nr:amidohydrolase [[Micrococcus luteus] ATCC 49442]
MSRSNMRIEMQRMEVDLLVHNADIITMDEFRPRATSLAVLHGRIVAVGDTAGLSAKRTLDAQGTTIIPGLGDSHNHMAWYGMGLSEIDLSGVRDLSTLYSLVAARAAELEPGEFVIGNGYYHAKTGGHPRREELDRAAGGRPVWLKHGSGHMAAVNTAVLEMAGVFDGTAVVPDGGVVERDDSGVPTGILEEQAQKLVVDLVTPYSLDHLSDSLERAAARYAAEGLTHVTEAGIGGGWVGKTPIELAAYQRVRDRGGLRVRVQLMPTVEALHPLLSHPDDHVDFGLDLGITSGFGDDLLRIGPMKIWLDGGLASRTAHVYEPFCDRHSHGYFHDDPEALRTQILQAHRSGWRIAAHAIGDRTIDFALDVFEEAQKRWPRPTVRHRFEHAAITSPEQIERMAQLGITPVPQAHFIHDLGDTMSAALGPQRSNSLYRVASFLKAGLRVPGSSDRPVANGAPLAGIQSMVERLTETGACLGPAERVDVHTALRSYTIDTAWIAGQENEWGRIRTGMAADFVLLGDDITKVATERISQTQVVATFLGGECTHGNSALQWQASSTPPLQNLISN